MSSTFEDRAGAPAHIVAPTPDAVKEAGRGAAPTQWLRPGNALAVGATVSVAGLLAWRRLRSRT